MTPTLFFPLCLLYLPLLPCYDCLLNAIQCISCLQAARGTLQEGPRLPHMLLDVVYVMLKYRNERTRLSIPVHLCGESLVVDIFQGGVKERCLISVALEPMKVISKVMQSIDSEIRCSVQWPSVILIIPLHLPHYLRIHLHNDLHIIS